MSLYRIGAVADDSGDVILVEADESGIYLTVNAEYDGPGPEFQDHECPQRCVALTGEQVTRFGELWAQALEIGGDRA